MFQVLPISCWEDYWEQQHWVICLIRLTGIVIKRFNSLIKNWAGPNKKLLHWWQHHWWEDCLHWKEQYHGEMILQRCSISHCNPPPVWKQCLSSQAMHGLHWSRDHWLDYCKSHPCIFLVVHWVHPPPTKCCWDSSQKPISFQNPKNWLKPLKIAISNNWSSLSPWFWVHSSAPTMEEEPSTLLATPQLLVSLEDFCCFLVLVWLMAAHLVTASVVSLNFLLLLLLALLECLVVVFWLLSSPNFFNLFFLIFSLPLFLNLSLKFFEKIRHFNSFNFFFFNFFLFIKLIIFKKLSKIKIKINKNLLLMLFTYWILWICFGSKKVKIFWKVFQNKQKEKKKMFKITFEQYEKNLIEKYPECKVNDELILTQIQFVEEGCKIFEFKGI